MRLLFDEGGVGVGYVWRAAGAQCAPLPVLVKFIGGVIF